MPNELPLDFRHVSDERQWFVLALREGAETYQLTGMEMVCRQFDYLPYGDATARSDIECACCLCRRQQARQQFGNVDHVNEIPDLTAIAHVDLCTSGQGRQQRWYKALRVVARPVG